jgi:hypothetical protein
VVKGTCEAVGAIWWYVDPSCFFLSPWNKLSNLRLKACKAASQHNPRMIRQKKIQSRRATTLWKNKRKTHFTSKIIIHLIRDAYIWVAALLYSADVLVGQLIMGHVYGLYYPFYIVVTRAASQWLSMI